MTSTIGAIFPMERPFRWNLLFAEDADKDLDFDEGLEEDELYHSKPPSRRPLLWIILILLVVGVGYWTLKDTSPLMPQLGSIEKAETKNEGQQSASPSDLPPPTFQEDQIVVLIEASGQSMLMGNPTSTKPGPMVKSGDPLIIIDGSWEIQGWMYLVRTESGKTGWVSGKKLRAKL
ncbi:MAG: SH3 domain-containing protein [Nitrospirales bacterium]